MTKFLLLISSLLFIVAAHCQDRYWQQRVDYTIAVTLNDKDHTLDGFEKIQYTNNSPDTLKFIWFHLWPNAYKNDKTALTDQLLEEGDTKFYFSNEKDRGYINRLDFKVNGVTAVQQDHPQHIDIMKLVLPEPLAPNGTVMITTSFHEKLPFNFSRGGHVGDSYQISQWYPKPAVYDKEGWHEMPYLNQGEYYAEFGEFDVSITLPSNYVVAATGELQDASEKQWMLGRSNFDWKPVVTKEKIKSGGVKTITQEFPASSATMKTLRYRQSSIHDFAWFADKRFVVNHDTCALKPDEVVDVYSYYLPGSKTVWENSVKYSKQAIRFYSDKVGAYPFTTVSVVEGPKAFYGGMEYPTITLIAPTNDANELNTTIAHEIGHNWFYGILGTNERAHPWMDEGINSYYTEKYKRSYSAAVLRLDPQQPLLETMIAEHLDQPIELTSDKYSQANYGLVAYYKTARWLDWLETELGTATFNKCMQEYFSRWQYKHPTRADMKKTFEDVSGKNLDAAFALLDKKGALPGWEKKGIGLQGPLGLAFNLKSSKKSIITLLPVLGFNSYDKLMAGVAITNFRLPPSKLQFLVTPMYGFGSKTMTGLGLINYSFYPKGAIRKVDIGVSGARFSADRYIDENDKKTFLAFNKIVPGLRLTFREKNPRSNSYKFIEFKSYMIKEEGLRFTRDSIITPIDTTIVTNVHKKSESRTLNQLRFVIENNRALYPYKAELKVEQAEFFVRAAFTGHYFFNYAKEGGLHLRLFAGKFFYTSPKTLSKQFATDRYHLNMTGANGYEDYTYSDYFVGRNEFQGIGSQQIMERDGAFKVRTDLLADKVGKTDDWLIAANFSTTIPPGLNPLNLLPVKIPLKIFADIGTYSDAWKRGTDLDRFLFDAGLQLSFIKETVNIYIPLVYSNVFSDYIKSTLEKKGRLFRTISFSIDVSNFSLRKLDRRIIF